MKLFIALALLITATASFAKKESTKTYIRPQVTVWPNGVDVRVWNNSDKDIRCNGTINVWTSKGKYKTHYYSATIYKGRTDYRRFANFDYQDPYRNGSNFINCRSY